MVCRAWPIVVASCALLAGCLDDQQALQTSDPIYTMVFFATDSVSLNKRAQDQLANTVSNPTPPIKAALQPNSKAKICVTGHTDKVGPETINKEVAQMQWPSTSSNWAYRSSALSRRAWAVPSH